MMNFPQKNILTMFSIFLFLSCASSPKPSLYETLNQEKCPDFTGYGIAENEKAAIDAAKAQIASEIKSSIAVSSELINESANGEVKKYYKQQIINNYSLDNANDAKVKMTKQQGKEFGVVVCMSRADAAKGFFEQQRLIIDSLELVSNTVLTTEHPKHKNEAWHKTQELYNKFISVQNLLEGLGVKNVYSANEIYGKTKENYKNYCKNTKIYWKAEPENIYSAIIFSKLSQSIKMENSICNGDGIYLVYKDIEPKCSFEFGINSCSYSPSLFINSCNGKEYSGLKGEVISAHQKSEFALDKLKSNLENAEFLDKWKQEIKEWSPQCE